MNLEDLPKQLLDDIDRECSSVEKSRPKKDSEKQFDTMLKRTVARPADYFGIGNLEAENAQIRADLAAVEKERDELLSSELTANALTMQYEEQLKKAEIEIKKIKVCGNCKNFSTFTLNNCCLFFGSLESPDGQCDSWVFLCDKC